MAKSKDIYAGVFLLTRDETVLLQQRDNKPDIQNPGLISTFGGGGEGDEGPVECALRELNEETGLILLPKSLHRLGKNLHKEVEGRTIECSFFFVRGVDPQQLTIVEGTMFEVSLADGATHPLLTPTCRLMFERLLNVGPTREERRPHQYGIPRPAL